MPPIPDQNVPHEQGVSDAVDAELRRTSTHAHIPDAVVAVAAPTKAEFDALVGKVNGILATLRDAEILPSS